MCDFFALGRGRCGLDLHVHGPLALDVNVEPEARALKPCEAIVSHSVISLNNTW